MDRLQHIWPEWVIEGKPLGKGSFGVVYHAVRRDHNVESHAAIKVISIPADSSEIDSLRSEGLDLNATKTYLQGIVNDFVGEIQLMESLKGVQNIVSVEDYKVVERKEELGWDIYIRMELLTPFNTYLCDRKMTEDEVIKLGCDMCTALELCSKRNIIHRDIKPENIFVNSFGDFKLGDFGIARKMENMTGGLSKKGTFNYMAPEVASGNKYDARVDIYSLGLVLYRFMNGNRLPFLDTEQQLMNPNERRNAVDRRLRGETLCAPCEASPAMADLILRACAFYPEARFTTATEMKKALLSVANGTYEMSDIEELDKTISVNDMYSEEDRTVSVHEKPLVSGHNKVHTVDTFDTIPEKKSKLPIVIAAVAAVVILVCAGIFFVPGLMGESEGDEPAKAELESTASALFDEEQTTSIISETEVMATSGNYEETETELEVNHVIEKIAMITDYGAIKTGSYNQLSWQGIQDICSKYQVPSICYQPDQDTYEARLEMVSKAIDEGCDVIVVSGYKFGKVIAECQNKYPDVYFIGNAVSAESFSVDGINMTNPEQNVVCITHAEEQAGYLAGYAAVADGYTKLGFLATNPAASIVRYGNGFLQGADAAAKELGRADVVKVRCAYAENLTPMTVTEVAEKWYTDGTEVIFQVGGDYMEEMVELCEKYSTKVIAADTDYAYLGVNVLTSAIKDIQNSVFVVLEELISGKWGEYGGNHQVLTVEDGDFVGIPAFQATWNFQNFTIEQYEKVKAEMRAGERGCLAEVDELFECVVEVVWGE